MDELFFTEIFACDGEYDLIFSKPSCPKETIYKPKPLPQKNEKSGKTS